MNQFAKQVRRMIIKERKYENIDIKTTEFIHEKDNYCTHYLDEKKIYFYATLHNFIIIMRSDNSYVNISDLCRRYGEELETYIDKSSVQLAITQLSQALHVNDKELIFADDISGDIYANPGIAIAMAKLISSALGSALHELMFLLTS